MTQEEKAKAYDEAIEKAKIFKEHLLEINEKDYADEMDYIFSELKESEDKRIRKALIMAINNICNGDDGLVTFNGFSKEQVLAWLEKQGEQKPTEKIEQEFKVGDWIVSDNNNVAHIESISETKYNLKCKDGYHEKMSIEYVDRCWHLWTIQDAKGGDVLVAKGEYFKEYIFIYSKMTDDDVISTHCGYDVIRNASNKTMSRLGRVEDFHSICPATKEQRDLLFQKMKEAGYEWDADKKELKKIEPKFKVGDWVVYDGWTTQILQVCQDGYVNNHQGFIPKEREDAMRLWDISDAKDGDVLVNGSNIFIFHFINGTRLMGYCHLNTDDGRFYDDIGKNECFCLIDAVVNPATKEQRDKLEKAMADAGYTFYFDKKELKKIKRRPMLSDFLNAEYEREKADALKCVEWSEEDEHRVKDIIYFLDTAKKHYTSAVELDACINWLKSLKKRYTWKPSDEQIEILNMILTNESMDDNIARILRELREQLKNLKRIEL